MRKLIGRRNLLVLAIVTPALVVTACSSSGNKGAGSPSSASSTSGVRSSSGASSSSSTPTGAPITIGFAAALTGSQADLYGPADKVSTAWAHWVNANGGINGHPVVIDVVDTQSTPTAGQAAVKKLVEQDHVQAIMVGDYAVDGVVASYLSSKNIAVFGANGFDTPPWGKSLNFFNTTTLAPFTSTAEVIAAHAVGGTKVGAAVCAEVPACAAVGQVLQPEAVKLGVTYTGITTIAASAANYTAQCLALIQKGTNVMIVAHTPATVSRYITDCLQQGYKGYFDFSSNSVTGASLPTNAGAQVTGDLSSFPWWANAPAVQTYRDAMTKYAPGTSYKGNALTGLWTDLEMFRKAVSGQTTGPITQASILNDFYQIKNETLGGLLPQPVTYTKGQPSPLISASFIFKYKAGDKDPQTVPPTGASCNGQTGDLASTCTN